MPNSGEHHVGRSDQVSQQPLAHVHYALVLGSVPGLMIRGEHPPHGIGNAEREGEHLEDEIAVVGAVPAIAERCERQGVSGVVGQVEAALYGEVPLSGIGQAGCARLDQSVELAAGSAARL